MGGKPAWSWRRWVITGAIVCLFLGTPTVWLTVWLLRKSERGADIATVLALPVATLSLLVAMLTAVLAWAALPAKLPMNQRQNGRHRSAAPTAQRVRRRPPLAARLGVWTVLLVVLAVLAVQLTPVGEAALVRLAGCGHAVQLRVLSSPDQLDPARRLAGEYERWTVGRNHGCQRANLYVYAAPPRESGQAMVGGWAGTALRDLGPQPDVWLADSAAQVHDVERAIRDAGATSRIVRNDVVARTPMVFAVTAPLAAELGGGADGRSWAGLVAETTRLGWDLVRPDPVRSPMGRLGTALLYGDGARARDVEQRIGRSLDGGGYPIADGLAVLCRYRELDPRYTAVVVTEQAMLRFNTGDPLGGSCGGREAPRTGDELLRAFYPSDTRSLDLRFVQLGWSGALQQREAASFGGWLTSDDGRRALLAVGLRPADGPVGDPLSGRNGVLAEAVTSSEAVDSAVLDAAMSRYDSAQRRGRVLLALDGSGSMGAAAGSGQGSRMEVATRAVTRAVLLMGEHDEFGLSVFPADRGGTGVRELVPIGERTGLVGAVPRLDATAAGLAALRPAGNTPLYEAVTEGVRALGPSDDSRVSALVVLTDGENTTGSLTPAQVRDAVAGDSVRVFVIAVGEATCVAIGLVETAADTGGLCVDADLATVDVRLSELFGALWGVTG